VISVPLAIVRIVRGLVRHQASTVQHDARFPSASALVGDSGVSMLVYRSRAVSLPTERDLDQLLRKAQERNRRESLTGLLIYDQGSYYQWLEGPPASLARVWDAIRRDPRHRDAQILREQPIPKRFFEAWDMRLAVRAKTDSDTGLAFVASDQLPPSERATPPTVLPGTAWDEIFSDVVVPKLKAAHLPTPVPVALVWHADAAAPAILAGTSLADEGAAAHYLNGLIDQGASLETLYQEVFEPAARYLGGLWYDDEKSDAEITLGLSRLQVEVRRLGATIPHPLHVIKPGHAVLVAPQPGEPHGVTAAMSSELFWRDGWEVSCEYPSTDQVLVDLVHDSWFDVLDLSLSGAYRRDDRLQAMGSSIRAAQAASLNPALAVIVNGRAFVERRHTYFSVGADAACVTVVESVATAQRLLDTLATQHRIEQALLDPPRSRGPAPIPLRTAGRPRTISKIGSRVTARSPVTARRFRP
jgi:hypothetical protein